MDNKKNGIPKLRFPGFTGAWEQRKLGETSKITAGGDVDKEKLLTHGKYPVIANALTNDGIVGYYNDAYRITAPAVTVTGRGEIGKAKSRKINFTPVVRLLSVESKHNVDFLAEAINRSKVVFESTGVPQLTVPKLSNYKISFPVSENEETKIGDFIQQFDSLIALHQRKLEHLQEQKKGLLQKMFPKNGETVPEVRFPGFTDAWEQRKLGETSKITAGGDVDKEKLLTHGKYPVIANALTNDGIVGYYNDAYRITAPAVTVTGRGEIGKAKSRKINFTPVVRLLSVESKHNVDFLAEAINRSKVVFESTGVPQLTVPKLSNYKISFPVSENEETKIGDFIQQFDSLIALHQRKLDHLELMKKGLLQQMFV